MSTVFFCCWQMKRKNGAGSFLKKKAKHSHWKNPSHTIHVWWPWCIYINEQWMIDIFMVHHTTAFITTIMIIKINNEFRFFAAPILYQIPQTCINKNTINTYQNPRFWFCVLNDSLGSRISTILFITCFGRPNFELPSWHKPCRRSIRRKGSFLANHRLQSKRNVSNCSPKNHWTLL